MTAHRPNAERHRRALELLSSCRDGCTEAIMLAHGLTTERMIDLVGAGLATATAERAWSGSAHDRGRARADHRGGTAGAHRAATGMIKTRQHLRIPRLIAAVVLTAIAIDFACAQPQEIHASEFWTIFGRDLKITDILLVAFTALLFLATAALWWSTR